MQWGVGWPGTPGWGHVVRRGLGRHPLPDPGCYTHKVTLTSDSQVTKIK